MTQSAQTAPLDFQKRGKVLYEDAAVIALLCTDKPAALGHILVYPKKSVAFLDELDDDLVIHLFYVASYAATAVFEGLSAHGTNIIVHEGKPFAPLCLQVLSRKEEDGIDLQWKPQKLSAEEMEKVKEKIKDKTDVMHAKKDAKKEVHLPSSSSAPSANAPTDSSHVIDDEENYLVKSLNRVP